MREWTPQQLSAIQARNRRVLVSAAAGSGKTAVLVERVMSLLQEGIPLDRMLVMTFTHAAANEMKERLAEQLSAAAAADPGLKKQYALLQRADIGTLHSFCQKIIRRHFQAAGTDPMSKLADEALADEMLREAMDAALDAFYTAPDEDARALADRFPDKSILAMAQALHTFLMAQAAPWEWLEQNAGEPEQSSLYEHPLYPFAVREAGLLLSGAEDLIRAAAGLCDLPDGPRRYASALEDDLHLVSVLQAALRESSRLHWPGLTFTKLPSGKVPEAENPAVSKQARDWRNKAKELMLQAIRLLPHSDAQAAAWMGDIRATRPQLRALAKLTRDAHERYQAAKAARALWDFNDLEHLALKALSDPGTAREVSGAYDALFVDEYQDVSHIQEAIITRLCSGRNSLFMVGDVKQSIYRFRLADPTLFLGKSRRFGHAPDAPERLITLKENFRSRPNILSAVNLVFEHAMREEATEIEYDDQARLTTLRPPDDGDPAVELWLIEKGEAEEEEEDFPEEPEAEDAEDAGEAGGEAGFSPAEQGQGEMEKAFVYEARLIARRIGALLGTPMGEGKDRRPLQLRDFAVLLRAAAGRAAVMAQILSDAGFPAYSDADGEYFAQQEVRDAVQLLEVLDNPFQDTPLLTALACPAFSLGPEALAAIRLAAPRPDAPFYEAFFALAKTDAACARAAETMDRWRFLSQNLPLEPFIRLLLRESGLYMLAGARPDGSLRRKNLRMLAARAAPSPLPQTLHGFLKRIRETLKHSAKSRSATLGMQEDVVRVMTLHKSKGLQFPVVFMPDLAASFQRKRPPFPLRLDAETGMALETVDPENRLKREDFALRTMKAKRAREELSEEARLMYVGMTRAQERLILIGAPRNPDSALRQWSLPGGLYQAASAGSMLDWAGTPLYPALRERRDLPWQAPNASRWHVFHRMTGTLRAENPAPQGLAAAAGEGETVSAPAVSPFGAAPQPPALPLKTSVTALVTGRAGIRSDEEETPDTKRREPSFTAPPTPLPRLAGDRALTGAQRGAAAHKALGALDFTRFSAAPAAEWDGIVRDELAKMEGAGLLLPLERQAVDPETLLRFLHSGLAKRMMQSPERHAEWTFTLKVEGGVLLQGVLDACFREAGGWVLVDYKTDRATPEEALRRYRGQMRWYMRALRDITGEPVREAWLYLLHQGEAAAVTEEGPIRLG